MSLQESITFRSSAHVVGVEILDAEHTSRHTKWFNTGFGIAMPTTWHGDVHYRGHQQPVLPGMVFCPMPGEVHTTPRVVRVGSFHVVMIDPAVFAAYVVEHDVSPDLANWRKSVARMSPTLAARMVNFLRAVKPSAGAMEVQSSVVNLFDSVVQELLERAPPLPKSEPRARAAEQIRECLHSQEGATLDLYALATRFGMSRFRCYAYFGSATGCLLMRTSCARG